MVVPVNMRLTALEVKLLNALQLYTREQDEYTVYARWAREAVKRKRLKVKKK